MQGLKDTHVVVVNVSVMTGAVVVTIVVVRDVLDNCQDQISVRQF